MFWDTGYRSENVSLSVCTVVCLIVMSLVQSQCVCFLAGNNESILCTVGQLYYVSESQFWSLCVCVCVCARLCSDLWKWAFNTITSWAIIKSLLKYWALYPWKHVSAAIEVKQWLTLAVIDFWSCYCQRIHLIEKIFWTLAVLSGSSYLFTLKSTWNKNWHNLFLLIRVICLIVHNSSKIFVCGSLNQNVITCF